MSYVVNVSENGRMSLPAALRKKLGLTAAGTVLINETEQGLVLQTREQAWTKARAIAAKFPNTSVDDFLSFRKTDSPE